MPLGVAHRLLGLVDISRAESVLWTGECLHWKVRVICIKQGPQHRFVNLPELASQGTGDWGRFPPVKIVHNCLAAGGDWQIVGVSKWHLDYLAISDIFSVLLLSCFGGNKTLSCRRRHATGTASPAPQVLVLVFPLKSTRTHTHTQLNCLLSGSRIPTPASVWLLGPSAFRLKTVQKPLEINKLRLSSAVRLLSSIWAAFRAAFL